MLITELNNTSLIIDKENERITLNTEDNKILITLNNTNFKASQQNNKTIDIFNLKFQTILKKLFLTKTNGDGEMDASDLLLKYFNLYKQFI